jgi:hypothetical protein
VCITLCYNYCNIDNTLAIIIAVSHVFSFCMCIPAVTISQSHVLVNHCLLASLYYAKESILRIYLHAFVFPDVVHAALPVSPSPSVTLTTAGVELMFPPLTSQIVTLNISPSTKHDLLLLTTASLLPLLKSTLLNSSSMGFPPNPQSNLKMNLPLL